MHHVSPPRSQQNRAAWIESHQMYRHARRTWWRCTPDAPHPTDVRSPLVHKVWSLRHTLAAGPEAGVQRYSQLGGPGQREAPAGRGPAAYYGQIPGGCKRNRRAEDEEKRREPQDGHAALPWEVSAITRRTPRSYKANGADCAATAARGSWHQHGGKPP